MSLSLQADWEEQGLLIVELQEELTVEHARRKAAERVLRQIVVLDLPATELRRLARQHFGEE